MGRGHARFSVDYLYSLYDALVSINVPSDKARAVVDAMERDMGTTLATKQDLEFLRRDTENRFALVDQRFDALQSFLGQRIDGVGSRSDQKFDSLESRLDQKFDSLESRSDQKIDSLESRSDQKIDSLESRLEQKIDALCSELTRDIAALDLKMTIKLGSMLFVGFGLMIAALRFWA